MHAPTRPARSIRLVIGSISLLMLAALFPASAGAVVGASLAGLPDKDFRAGLIQPSVAQKTRVTQLGAAVRWNKFGTPQSLIKHGGWLATGLGGSPENAARTFVRNNRTLFRLSDADVTRLELVAANKLTGTNAYAVLFRQRYGNLAAGQDGLIVVGIREGKIGYVSSSATGTMAAPASATLSPTAAWLKAAAHVGRVTNAGAITNQRSIDGWTVFRANGFGTPATGKSAASDQRARLVAVPTFQNGVRPAFETIVLDLSTANPTAYTVFVDARSGGILMRYNRVDYLEAQRDEFEPAAINDAPTFGQFSGITAEPSDCGPDHVIAVPAGTTTIDIVATATIAATRHRAVPARWREGRDHAF